MKRIHNAQQKYIKGVILNKKIYKLDNYRLWKFHYHIGITYMMQGKLRNAINSLLKSLKLVKNFSGSRSKELMSIYFRLGDIYFEQNKKSQALENYKNGLEIECKGNLNESEKYECQGKMLLSEGKGEKALEKFQDCLNHKMKLLGKAHPDLSECYLQIAKAYAHEEKYQEALENLKQGQEVIEKHFGDSNVNLYLVHQCAGKVYMKKSMYKESFESYHKSLVIIKKAFGNKNSIMGEIYRDFATMYRNQGKFDSALVYLKMATDMQQTTWNREHLKVFVSSFNLGCLYGSIGHYDLGIRHLEGSKMSLDKAKCQHEIKEENVEKKIALLKKKLALSRSLDC